MVPQIFREKALGFRYAVLAWLVVSVLILATPVSAQKKRVVVQPQITNLNWGLVTAPTFGSSETGTYAGAELFAGPNKFGSYYSGVLPNGRFVTPAGISAQIGMNPLGIAVTADGKYLITSNDDERDGGFASYLSGTNKGGYSLSVVDTSTMTVVSQYNVTGRFFIGLQVTGTGPYTVWVSGGGDNNIKVFSVDTAGAITFSSAITIPPLTASTDGHVSNYTTSSFVGPIPSGFSRTPGAKITFPAGSALSINGRYLYVACNGDNSLAVIDTQTQTVVRQLYAGYFPYAVSVSSDGKKVFVSNWGVTDYKFKSPTYDVSGNLTALGTTGANAPDGYYVPVQSRTGFNPKSSSVTVYNVPDPSDPTSLFLKKSIFQGKILNLNTAIGDSHPSATAIIGGVLFVAKTNSDRLGLIDVASSTKLPDFELSPVKVTLPPGNPSVHGAYPNALAASPDGTRLYVAEAGINSVAVLDVSTPTSPTLLGRIPTGWYPSALAVSADGGTLYVTNAKGIGEDINSAIDTTAAHAPSGVESDQDGNYIFGSVQKIDLATAAPGDTLPNNFTIQSAADASVVPVGAPASARIKTVIFILHENKTFDTMLGNLGGHFGTFASTTFNNRDGSLNPQVQNTGVALNTQLLASTFATAVNYYSDSEESDAGHQFAASGTATDYTEKTLLVKSGRGLLVNKNFEPEDYPENGYIFNNAARHGVTFKDYGALVRIEGTDTGTNTPTTLNDPGSGNAGFPQVTGTSVSNPLINLGDVTTATSGLGQSYFLSLPILGILGTNNGNGEARLDKNYPGYNFNISDQRRALEFIADFDRMVAAGTLPKFIYIYEPNDHCGGIQAPNSAAVGGGTCLQEVADGDVGLGMVVKHIMASPIYYNAKKNTGAAIFMTYDDAQSSLDHIHPHRTPLILISPFAKPGYIGKQHYVTASVVKTEELLLGLPPNNLGDLFATDVRDLFQSTYNGIKATDLTFNTAINYQPSQEGVRIWALVKNLDLSGPDRDSRRLGVLSRLSQKADDLHKSAAESKTLETPEYRKQQEKLWEDARRLVGIAAVKQADGAE